MGCGDDILNVATGGVSGAISGRDPIQSMMDAATFAATGGVSALNNDIGRLTRATAESAISGGITNIQAAAKYRNFANQMDAMIDPSRVNDQWIRQSGEYLEEVPLGHEARQIAPAVLAAVGTIYGGPAGSMAGYYLGNKIKGGTNEQGLIGGAMAGGTAFVGGAVSPYLSEAMQNTGVNQMVANAIAQGATGAGLGAAGAAAMGGDPGQGAMMGGVGGAIAGAASPATQGLTNSLVQEGVNPVVANALAQGLTGSATGAIGSAIGGGDPGTGAMLGGAGGVMAGGTRALTGDKNYASLASSLAKRGISMMTQPTSTSGAPTVNALRTITTQPVPSTLASGAGGVPTLNDIILQRLYGATGRTMINRGAQVEQS